MLRLQYQGLHITNEPKTQQLVERLQQSAQLSVKHYDIRLRKHVINTEQFWTYANTNVHSNSIKDTTIVFPRYLMSMCLSKEELDHMLQGLTITDHHDALTQVQRIYQFRGSLRTDIDRQDVASKACVDSLRSYGGAVLSMPPGRGKTVTACHIIATMQVSALVLVHTHELVTQWIERIGQYLPDANIGEYKNHQVKARAKSSLVDIVVATMQSVCMTGAPTMKDIGLIIVDEAHHICATTLRLSLTKVNAPYTLGLTATPERKDLRTLYLYWALGPLAFCLKVPYDLPVRVLTMVYRDQHIDALTNHFQDLESRLCGNTHRIHQVLGQTFAALSDLRHRSILILATRLDVVECAHRFIVDHMCPRYGLDPGLVFRLESGKTIHNTLAKVKGRILLSSDKLVNEGFDVPRLDTLIRLMPTTETKQTVGRVMRSHPDKQLPVTIVDIDDVCSQMLHGMWSKRTTCLRTGEFTTAECTHEKMELEQCPLGPVEPKRNRYRPRRFQ